LENKFPKGFLWGSATSAHQVEGNNHNDWSEWEKSRQRVSYLKSMGRNPDEFISGRTCDHYNRFRADFDIAKSLGHNAHRFSIEWSRIEPEEGKFNEKEIEHYRDVIKALRERGLEPFITLWHWTIPLWVRDKGGVESKEFPKFFARFSKKMAEDFPEVKYWMTLNEPTSVIANSYFRGLWPPQKKSIYSVIRVYNVLAKAHKMAYFAIHEINPEAQVGFGNLMIDLEPFSLNLLDIFASKFRDYWSNIYFLKLVGDLNDYYALQYYFHLKISFPQRVRNENQKISDMGWEIYPKGIYNLLKRLGKLKKPIFITENGIADNIDKNRAQFIEEHLKWISKAGEEGVDIRGYFYWSLMDNFEWESGFGPRFGLVEIDYKTLERKIRPSALAYKKIIESQKG